MATTLLVPQSLGPVKTAARAEMLEEAFGRLLEREVRVEAVQDYGELGRRVKDGRFELAWVPAALCAGADSRRIFRVIRRGGGLERSALVVRQGEVTTVEGLRGRRAVWVDPLSAGGHLLAVRWLRDRGFDPERDLAEQRFAGSYAAALRAVADGEADVSAVYAHAADPSEATANVIDIIGRRGERLEVLGVTGGTAGDGILVGHGLPAGDADDVAERLEGLTSPSGGGLMCLQLLDAERLAPGDPSDWEALAFGDRS